MGARAFIRDFNEPFSSFESDEAGAKSTRRTALTETVVFFFLFTPFHLPKFAIRLDVRRSTHLLTRFIDVCKASAYVQGQPVFRLPSDRVQHDND